jgi:hypothetical protein
MYFSKYSAIYKRTAKYTAEPDGVQMIEQMEDARGIRFAGREIRTKIYAIILFSTPAFDRMKL